MTLVETVLLALRNLKANKLRTFLSVLGVMVGVGAVITVISVGMSAQAEIARNISDLGSNMIAVVPNLNASQDPRKVMKFMTLELSARMLEAAPALSAVSAVAQSNATLTYRGEPTTASLTGIEPEYARIMTTKIALGRGIVHSDLDSSSHVIVLGSAVARDLFADLDPIGRQVSVTVGERSRPFTVVGVVEPKGSVFLSDMDRQAFIPVTTMVYKMLPSRNVSMFFCQTSSPDDADAAVAQLKRYLSTVAGDDRAFEVSSQQALLKATRQITSIVTAMLTVIAGISLLVSGLGIMNTLLTSVAERTREIGVRKSLGARNEDIRSQFLVEAVVLSSLGGAAGLALGYVGAGIASAALGWPMAFNWLAVVAAIGFSTLVGLAFGTYPAARASNMDPVAALRYE
ncbi:MAG: ABC transporter permease [Bacillota bacterium]|jgi:putative ABC transport system permease protein|nr:FtsX-like permease family protein [Bacillota bacterium]